MKCGKTGATLLYGTKCVGCDCQFARFADGGVFSVEGLERLSERMTREAKEHLDCHPRGTGHMGFDLASKPDVAAKVTIHRAGDEFHYAVDDIEWMEVPGAAEQMAEFYRRQREAMEEAIMGGKRWDHAMDGRSRPEHWSTPPHRHAIEVITDPDDRRGMDAQPARVR